MYNIVKVVIETGKFELSDILKKIDIQWIQNTITDVQRMELINLAQSKANIQNSIDIMAKLEEMDKRLKALENVQTSTEEVTADEYVAGKWYYNGDKVTYEGSTYTCIAPEGAVCVWSPVEYPAYWEEI